jgi:hypothetical protein
LTFAWSASGQPFAQSRELMVEIQHDRGASDPESSSSARVSHSDKPLPIRAALGVVLDQLNNPGKHCDHPASGGHARDRDGRPVLLGPDTSRDIVRAIQADVESAHFSSHLALPGSVFPAGVDLERFHIDRGQKPL